MTKIHQKLEKPSFRDFYTPWTGYENLFIEYHWDSQLNSVEKFHSLPQEQEILRSVEDQNFPVFSSKSPQVIPSPPLI